MTALKNKLSVLLELQADCLAGVWGHHAGNTRQLLEAGDIEEGLAAAIAIGDDTLQKQSHGHVSPDSFTHGSSVQRVRWFKTGGKRQSTGEAFIKSAVRALGSQIGRQIIRGIMGSFFGGRR